MFLRAKYLFIGFYLFLSAFSASFAGTVRLQDESYLNIANQIISQIDSKGYAPEEVLVLTDIDTTVLLMNQTLGSENWFQWQESLLKPKADPSMRVAANFEDLLKGVDLVYGISKTHLVEENQAKAIELLQNRGVKFMALTSRGPRTRDITLRELLRNGVDLSKSSIVADGAAFVPYDSKDPEKSGISADYLKKLEIKNEPRLVLVNGGVFFTEGQHKGLMLRTLLNRTGYKPKLVVFIDNLEKHIGRVISAMKDEQSFDTWSVLYPRANENPEKPGELRELTTAEKEKADLDWRNLNATIASIFPEK